MLGSVPIRTRLIYSTGKYQSALYYNYTGLPLLYVGALTIPLGFVRTDHYREYHSYDYGYEQA